MRRRNSWLEAMITWPTRNTWIGICIAAIASSLLLIALRHWDRNTAGEKFAVYGRLFFLASMFAGAILGTTIPRFYRRKQRRRFAAGLCRTCGYDIRHHQVGQNCPECGTPILSKPENIPRL